MKNVLNMRGDEARQQFVEHHEIVPIFRRYLAKGEECRCVCKNPVEKEIIFLEAKDKLTNKRTNLFLGNHCSNRILKFSGKQQPPLFSLFQTESVSSESEPTTTDREPAEKNTLDFCPINLELYNAIGILCESWNISFPKGDLLQILLFITKNPQIPTQDWSILKFNGMVGKDANGRKLVQMLSDLREGGKKLKYFTFHKINAVINEASDFNNVE